MSAQGGCVVDAVPGHGHDVALLLQHADEGEFLFRRDPREDRCARGDLRQLAGGEVAQIVAGDHGRGQAEAGRDRAGGGGVVTGDHLDLDARRAAVADGGDRRGTGRVVHALGAEQDESPGCAIRSSGS